MKLGLILCCLFIARLATGQSSKEVLGSFEIGCKVFNYNFKTMSNGLHSFRIDDIDKEASLVVFDVSLAKRLFDTLTKVQNALPKTFATSADSLKNMDISQALKEYLAFCQQITANTLTMRFWYTNQHRSNFLLKTSEALKLEGINGADTTLKAFNKLLAEMMPKIVKAVETTEYPLNEFNQEVFVKLVSNILEIQRFLFRPECASDIPKKATSIFFDIKAKLDFLEDEPVTAYIKLKTQRINCYYSPSTFINDFGKDTVIENKLIVDNVSLEFEDGNIKNIFVDLRYDDERDTLRSAIKLPMRFKNIFPISVSGRNDPDIFNSIKIFVGNTRDLSSNFKLERKNRTLKLSPYSVINSFSDSIYGSRFTAQLNHSLTSIPDPPISGQFYFVLSDLLEYYIVAENDKEDYSPANSVIELNKNNPIQSLKKEKRSKILTVRTFTDLIGVQDDQPNGLIQIEVSRKFNLYTKRKGRKNVYRGIGTYLEPILTFSKIEQKNNLLPVTVSNIDSAALSENRKAFTLNVIDLLKYQSSSLDVNFNYIKFNVPSIKSNIQLNISAGIFRTRVSDSVSVTGSTAAKSSQPSDTTLNSFRWGVSALYDLKPDSRFGITFGIDYRNAFILNNSYSVNNRSYVTVWTDAFLRTNEANKLFFRYRFNFVTRDPKYNFAQIQLGYLADLFKGTK